MPLPVILVQFVQRCWTVLDAGMLANTCLLPPPWGGSRRGGGREACPGGVGNHPTPTEPLAGSSWRCLTRVFFVLRCCMQQTFRQDRPRKLAIRARRGVPRLSDPAPAALDSGQPASSPGKDLSGR